MDIEHLIAELNPEQQQAVTSNNPRILCIAGAGAGKTKSLALRIVRLLAAGTASERILAVTFTRAAAAEMLERVGLLLAQLGLDHIELPDVRTLHSWGAQLLRTYAEHFGRNGDFTIYDEHDHEDVVRACARDLGIKKHDSSKLATLWREERVQAEYQRRLLEGNALDYDMIESCTLKLLQEHPGAQDRWVSRYRHVLVDEYQDTNLAQVAIVSRLSPPNLFIVGDPRQCQPAGSAVLTPKGWTTIEKLRDGDEVCGWDRRGAHVFTDVGSPVRVGSRPYTGWMYRIVTESGRETRCTDTHRWVARWNNERMADEHVVYVMRRSFDGIGPCYRVGWCRLLSPDSKAGTVHHFKQRARLEGADAMWLLHLTSSRPVASAVESITSVRYQLPTVLFQPTHNNAMYTPTILDRIWRETQALSAAGFDRLAADHGLLVEHPHYAWRGGHRGGRQTLFETVGANLRVGMMVPVWDGGAGYRWETIERIEREWCDDVPVYSLDVENHHAYVTDGGICTLNSIYLFRGAEPATIVEAARSADYEVIELVSNYRSVPEVIELANGCVDGDWQPMVAHRPAGRGDAVTTHRVRHQAPGVCELLHQLHDVDGYRWGDIYVLGRTWAAVDQVREILAEQAVPHRYCGKETDPWATDDGRNLARMALLLRNPADANLVALLAEWGAVGVARVPDLQRQRGEALRARRTLLQQLAEVVPALDGEVVPAWRAIRDIVGGLRVDEHGELTDGRLVADVVEDAIEAMGVFRAYAARDLVTRVATLRALLDGLRKLQLASLDVFASWWIERSQQDHIREAVDHDEVSLMTVHGSKGLEAPVVVMLDCYDGQYPSGRIGQSDEERRENLRIFYVGVTRARDRLLLVQPTHVTPPWGGPTESVQPSPYLARAGAPPPSTWQPETWGGALPSGW